MTHLPNKLRVELSSLIYSEQLSDLHFFKRKSAHFLATIAPLLKPMNLSKGEYVYLKDDPLDSSKLELMCLVYFIKKGETAYVEKKPEADLVFAMNRAGSYFGDVDFIFIEEDSDSFRNFTVKARTDVELLTLAK